MIRCTRKTPTFLLNLVCCVMHDPNQGNDTHQWQAPVMAPNKYNTHYIPTIGQSHCAVLSRKLRKR